MYEQTGSYYALFGPQAAVTAAEERFFAHWIEGRRKALDLGAGLCGPATMLARMGLEVLAFEPEPALAVLALDRLGRGDEFARRVTLVEGSVEEFAEPFAADVILLRSVLMLLDDSKRAAALEAARRHAAADARLIVDVRTAALPWAEQGSAIEEKRIGHTLFRRMTDYERDASGATLVHWKVDAERFGRSQQLARESFRVRADTPQDLEQLLQRSGFAIEQLYGGYDLDLPYTDSSAMLVAIAQRSE